MFRKVITSNLIAVLVQQGVFFCKGVEGWQEMHVYTPLFADVHTHMHTAIF